MARQVYLAPTYGTFVSAQLRLNSDSGSVLAKVWLRPLQAEDTVETALEPIIITGVQRSRLLLTVHDRRSIYV